MNRKEAPSDHERSVSLILEFDLSLRTRLLVLIAALRLALFEFQQARVKRGGIEEVDVFQ